MPLPEPVFRFAIIRRAQLPRFGLAVSDLDLSADLSPLLSMRGEGATRQAVVDVAARFQEGPEFVGTPEAVALAGELAEIGRLLPADRALGADDVASAVASATGDTPRALLASEQYRTSRSQVADAVVAMTASGTGSREALAAFTAQFRVLELIRLAVQDPAAFDAALSLPDIERTAVQLPAQVFPLPRRDRTRPTPPPGRPPADVERLTTRLADLSRAVDDILTVRAFALPEGRGEGDAGSARGGIHGVRLAPGSAARLSVSSRELLEALGEDLDTTPVLSVLDRLDAEREQTATLLRAATVVPKGPGRIKVGPTTLPAPLPDLDDDFATPDAPFSPVRPAGVMRLLVTRQHIARYMDGEIAHVENVMRTESRSRETRRLTRTEETFTIEREETTEEERDLQSTDRTELQREVERTLTQQQQFRVGFTLGASFGPVVTEASTEFGTSSSTEESSRTASSFAREVTEHASLKLTTRIREQQTRTTLQEFEETNRHGFDNTAGDTHAVGIYQWLDKVYELQTYDYGVRLAFDIVVPQPSAFLMSSVLQGLAATEGITAPEAFDLTPADITLNNWTELVGRWQATGVDAPPPLYTIVAHTVGREMAAGGGAQGEEDEEAAAPGPRAFATATSLTVPKGYAAFAAWFHGEATRVGLEDPEGGIHFAQLTVQVGRIEQAISGGDPIGSGFLSLEQGSLPVAVLAADASAAVVTVEVWCIRTNDAVEAWRMTTFDTLVTAYRERLSEYEERLATAAAAEGVRITGRNPLDNRRLEREELTRLSIMMLADEDFVGTNVAVTGEDRLTFDPNQAIARGRYARFWHEAIDWDNMAFDLLPYFWSKRVSGWVERLQIENTDPEHAAFLRSGAARVLLAVTPGFERAVLRFIDTGQLWTDGPEPVVANPDHAALLDEIDRARARPIAEEATFGDPWQVTLPTTLVALRPGDSLPAWERDVDGEWRPVP